MMLDKAFKLVGSTVREIGVLVIVFAPLEASLREQKPPPVEVGGLVLAHQARKLSTVTGKRAA